MAGEMKMTELPEISPGGFKAGTIGWLKEVRGWWSIQWEKDMVVYHRGRTFQAIEESGRRFWAYRGPDTWAQRQEFMCAEEAKEYIDRELEAEEN